MFFLKIDCNRAENRIVLGAGFYLTSTGQTYAKYAQTFVYVWAKFLLFWANLFSTFGQIFCSFGQARQFLWTNSHLS